MVLVPGGVRWFLVAWCYRVRLVLVWDRIEYIYQGFRCFLFVFRSGDPVWSLLLLLSRFLVPVAWCLVLCDRPWPGLLCLVRSGAGSGVILGRSCAGSWFRSLLYFVAFLRYFVVIVSKKLDRSVLALPGFFKLFDLYILITQIGV